MNVTSKNIFGKLVDDDGRCEHYHSLLDVITNRCQKCGKFYACFKCHDELENHTFYPVDSDAENTVMCGVCGQTYSYREYANLCECKKCGSGFNPKCSLHKNIYSKVGN